LSEQTQRIEFMDSIVEWVESHPYLLGGVLLAIVVLYVLYSNAANAASSASASTAASTATSAPDDAIQEAEIAAGTTVAQTQLSANAAVAQDNATINETALAAQVANAQTSASVQNNNVNTQASLTLGLANAGQSTSSILELLGGQPGASPFTQNLISSGVPASVPGGGGIVSVTNVSTPSYSSSPNPQVYQTPIVNSTPVSIAGQTSTIAQSATVATDPSDNPSLYESNVTGTDEETGTSYDLNPQYYATPQAASSLASILGAQTATAASVVGATGGPFVNPSSTGIVVSQGTPTGAGVANAGQILSGLQNTAPGTWATQLAGYGFTLTAPEESQISELFGSNQAVPDDTSDTTAQAA
jgi:hypothetical protein